MKKYVKLFTEIEGRLSVDEMRYTSFKQKGQEM